jgi:hypothetical protein
MRHLLRIPLATAILLPLLQAQTPPQLIGVTFGPSVLPNSSAVAFSTTSSIVTTIGPTGTQRLNSLATVQGVLYSLAATGPTSSPTRQLVRIEPLTGASQVVGNLNLDVRGLAEVPGSNALFAIVNATPDNLVRIDLPALTTTTIGATFFSSIQALAHDGTDLWAWDVNQGLLRVNPTTGAAIDVDPAIGTQGNNIQFLTWDGQSLLGGQNELLQVNRTTGVVLPFAGGPTTLADVRGAEVRRAIPFGDGCAASGVTPPVLKLGGEVRAGGTVFPRVDGLPSFVPGLLIVGLSNTSWNGTPLPLDLDPIFGTNDCELLVSADLLLGAGSDGTGAMLVALGLPNVIGAEIYIQMAVLSSTLANPRLSGGAVAKLLL